MARYRVALRNDPPGGTDGGKLTLNGVDVTSQVDFSPADFNNLQFVAGSACSHQDLLVVARSGKTDGHGGLTNIVDSPAVQITASVTGTRSVNAVAALRSASIPSDGDYSFLDVARQASIFSGFGATRPALTTAGNFTAEAGDSLSLNGLYDAGADAFTVARYRVALRNDPPGGTDGGKLTLNGVDVTSQVDFSPADFNNLQFVAGSAGSHQDLLVVARSGKTDGHGGLTNIVDSPAVQITASVTGTRSVNAVAALRSASIPSDGDYSFLDVARQSAIYSGYGATRPALTTAGNFTAEAGDSLSLNGLYDAGADAFTVARYRVALRNDPPGGTDGGKLTLNGVDVTSQVDFSAADFNNLQFVAGSAGSHQDLLVVARSGKTDGHGGLTNIVDSPAVQITASVTGTRSVNAVAALRSASILSDGDYSLLDVARQASIFSGYGATRPALTTAGNFTAEAGDGFSLNGLYDAGADAFTVARYRVALRNDPPGGTDGGKLMLNGVDVTSQVDFSPADFNNLQFVAGSAGSHQDLVVVARSGKDDGHGGLTNIVDSPAVQITASVTGARSVNAVAALRSASIPSDGDYSFLDVARQSAIYSGYGAARPALTTAGNFTAEAGDSLSLNGLYDAGADAFTVARYRVALRNDPPGGTDGGKLMLNGVDVTSQVDFSPADFNNLQFVAGSAGSRQDLVVVARSGKTDGHGGLTNIVDSPAVQITASVTGARSVNAVAALRSASIPSDGDYSFLDVARQSAIYSGYGAARPALTTSVPDTPPLPLDTLADAVGAFQATAAAGTPSSSAVKLLALYPGATGSSVAASVTSTDDTLRALLLLLGNEEVGGSLVGGLASTTQQQVTLAYQQAG